MGKRSTARRLAMQALYQADISGFEIEAALQNIFEAEKFIKDTTDFAAALAKQAWMNRTKNDKIISSLAIDWSLDRIGKVDRSILRLALEELNDSETPVSVVVNEAVELAKKYSGEEAGKFINGILGTFLRSRRDAPA